MSDATALIAGIGAMLSGLAALGTLWVTVRRGSDRESKRAATVAIEVSKDESIPPLERGEGGDPA